MSETKRCPQCQAEIPAGAPEGLCPQCLLQAGLQPKSAEAEAKTAPFAPSGSRFEPPTPEALQPAFPQLEILELLGKGGMGAVYKARQPGLDRLVAVKILPPEVSHDPAFAERFTREARALAMLNHPNIVGVYDSGRAGGYYYFVMEYLDGVNLRQAMRAGDLKSAEALKIVPQICEALQFAHDEGIVHRDIKPENILLDKKGRVKIADFGLAKLLGRPAADVSLTGTQQVMGTMHYMAPEQLEGARDVDHRADIYSLGVTFYEMLTGELPIGRFAAPSKKVQIDVRLDEVVLRSLEKAPEQRYQHASEIKTDVDTIANESAVPAAEPSASESTRAAPPVGYLRFVVAPTAALCAILLLAGFVLGILLQLSGIQEDNVAFAFGLAFGIGIVLVALMFPILNAVWFYRAEVRAMDAKNPRRLWLFQVLGAILVLASLSGIFALMAEFLVPAEIPGWLAAQPGLASAYDVYRIAYGAVSYVLNFANIAVGVGLILRLPWCRRSAIALTLIDAVLILMVQAPIEFAFDFQAIPADPIPLDAEPQNSVYRALNLNTHDARVDFLIGRYTFTAIWLLVLNLLVVFYLARPHVRKLFGEKDAAVDSVSEPLAASAT